MIGPAEEPRRRGRAYDSGPTTLIAVGGFAAHHRLLPIRALSSGGRESP